MKLVFSKIKDSSLNILRRSGYSFQRRDEQTGEMSFIKRIGNADYPRFHIYTKSLNNGGAEINLHIDQKKASYHGSAAHSGEYQIEDNEWLQREAEEIKKGFEN
jgi:hypothetical protein